MARILIVEDEEVLSTAFRLILERDGHDIEIARDGLEGLKNARENKSDLIFLDLLMPNMGGIEFLQAYFSDHKLKDQDTRIVVLSNLHDSKTVDQTLKLGAKEYVVKSQMTPVTLSQLASKWLA